jgi:hypothetical protein
MWGGSDEADSRRPPPAWTPKRGNVSVTTCRRHNSELMGQTAQTVCDCVPLLSTPIVKPFRSPHVRRLFC